MPVKSLNKCRITKSAEKKSENFRFKWSHKDTTHVQKQKQKF